MIEIMSIWVTNQLRSLATSEKRVRAGASVFHSGERVRSIHLVEEGAVHLVRYQPSGAMIVLQRAGSGAILAEASLFADHYHCSAVAAAHSRLLCVPKARLRARLADDPAAAAAWCGHLAAEIQNARLRAEILSMRTIAARLDAWLAWHDDEKPGRLAWKSVAAEIAVSPEALYRELSRRRNAAPSRRKARVS